jgi:hypothetical protein
MAQDEMNRQALKILLKLCTRKRVKLQNRCSGAIICAFLRMSLKMLDDDCSCQLIFILEARLVRYTKIPQVPEEHDIKVAASLLEVAEKSLDKVYGM